MRLGSQLDDVNQTITGFTDTFEKHFKEIKIFSFTVDKCQFCHWKKIRYFWNVLLQFVFFYIQTSDFSVTESQVPEYYVWFPMLYKMPLKKSP